MLSLRRVPDFCLLCQGRRAPRRTKYGDPDHDAEASCVNTVEAHIGRCSDLVVNLLLQPYSKDFITWAKNIDASVIWHNLRRSLTDCGQILIRRDTPQILSVHLWSWAAPTCHTRSPCVDSTVQALLSPCKKFGTCQLFAWIVLRCHALPMYSKELRSSTIIVLALQLTNQLVQLAGFAEHWCNELVHLLLLGRF